MLEVQEGDRVVVAQGSKPVKGRVKEVLGANAVRVTTSKEDEGAIYERNQVFLLYRYVTKEVETILGKVEVNGLVPLFFEKQ
jgi:hypothetical protein